jgi:hypothetical protein
MRSNRKAVSGQPLPGCAAVFAVAAFMQLARFPNALPASWAGARLTIEKGNNV